MGVRKSFPKRIKSQITRFIEPPRSAIAKKPQKSAKLFGI